MRRIAYVLLVLGALPIGTIAESAQAASVADFYELGACLRNSGFWWRRGGESDSARI